MRTPDFGPDSDSHPRAVTDIYPAAWIFFIAFVIIVALGLLNLLTGVFIQSLMAITEEANIEEKHEMIANKRKILKTIGALFKEFDKDDGGTLDEDELPALLHECRELQEMLDMVELPFEKLVFACKVADYDLSDRYYDPEKNQYFDAIRKPPPVEESDDFVRDSTSHPNDVAAIKMTDGIMECELLDCLLYMDDAPTRGDHFNQMKNVRRLDYRVQNVESALARVEGDITEILRVVGGKPAAERDPPPPPPPPSSQPEKKNRLDTKTSIATTPKGNDDVDNMIDMIFARYDFDNSNDVNSPEEMEQLTLNLVYKLQLNQIDAKHASANLWVTSVIAALAEQRGTDVDDENPLSLDEYRQFFRSAFAGSLANRRVKK